MTQTPSQSKSTLQMLAPYLDIALGRGPGASGLHRGKHKGEHNTCKQHTHHERVEKKKKKRKERKGKERKGKMNAVPRTRAWEKKKNWRKQKGLSKQHLRVSFVACLRTDYFACRVSTPEQKQNNKQTKHKGSPDLLSLHFLLSCSLACSLLSL